MGKTIKCAECGKKSTLPFTPKGNGPFYCKKHYKEKKQKEEGDAPVAAVGGMGMGMSQVPVQAQSTSTETKQQMNLTVAMSPQLQDPEEIPEEEKVLPGLKNLKES